jgi:hypothetical protein
MDLGKTLIGILLIWQEIQRLSIEKTAVDLEVE